MASIYKIYFKQKPDVIYIGSAIDFNLRKIRHKHLLKKGIHRNLYLQRLYNKYGHDNLVFQAIEEVANPEILIQKEQVYINLLNPQINILKIAGSALGYRHTEAAKIKIRSANTGRKMTKEQIIRGVIARIGQKTSKGCKRNIETKRKISEAKKKKVINFKTAKIFNSIQDAAESVGLKYSTLYAKLSHRNSNNTDLRFY
jgi:group I intron endonuclease